MIDSAIIQPRLLALSDENNRNPLALSLESGGFFTFGRESTCDWQIKDVAVSRRHCHIVREGDEFALEDLGSHNGTFVNDLPVVKRRLEHGDRIRIGNAFFVFLVNETDDAPFTDARFDDGSLQTNSTIRLFANQDAADFPTDLSVLVKLGKTVNESKGTKDLQRRILETILEIIPARRGAILFADEDNEEPQAVCVWAKNQIGNAQMQISRTVCRQVLREQAALLSNDLSDGTFDAAKSLYASRVSSLLCVPLRRAGDREGLIYLDASDPKISFTETHLEQITAISFLISAALAQAEAIENLRQENAILKDSLQIETNMIGESRELKEVFNLIGKAAPIESTILITGESGTGKELVAQAVHRNSRRRAKPFVPINCAVLNENLLESELFGHERGAFTGAFERKHGKLEIAGGGTIFFDEIGELSLPIQAKLLRVLQEREFERVGGTQTVKIDVRIIAATNRDLEAAVGSGKFREDLFFRLNVVQIKVPPLRLRRSDIPLLAQHFVRKYSEQCHRRVVGISKEAKKILLENKWRGNVRELENVIERAVVLGTSDKITSEDLPPEMLAAVSAEGVAANGNFHEQLIQAKQKILLTAVQNANGNISEAARRLSIHASNLHRIAREIGIKDDLKLK
jgi:Nif-specific regulatory protein